jgi:hypothetical protein
MIACCLGSGLLVVCRERNSSFIELAYEDESRRDVDDVNDVSIFQRNDRLKIFHAGWIRMDKGGTETKQPSSLHVLTGFTSTRGVCGLSIRTLVRKNRKKMAINSGLTSTVYLLPVPGS